MDPERASVAVTDGSILKQLLHQTRWLDASFLIPYTRRILRRAMAHTLIAGGGLKLRVREFAAARRRSVV